MIQEQTAQLTSTPITLASSDLPRAPHLPCKDSEYVDKTPQYNNSEKGIAESTIDFDPFIHLIHESCRGKSWPSMTIVRIRYPSTVKIRGLHTHNEVAFSGAHPFQLQISKAPRFSNSINHATSSLRSVALLRKRPIQLTPFSSTLSTQFASFRPADGLLPHH